ncbi:hypothetical protein AcV5_001639 [Taiwanofungus camphoratus]|nr:hypothetical protein AcV5_001639 [Antrodia cinnamomea]KAI0922325.1 hypothetical protein AcV7_005884 [Antrodia cinnamomea]
MAPRLSTASHRNLLARDQSPSHADFAAVKRQWQNPNDILTLLMIIGGDIVQRALAQLAGSSSFPVAPVAFSFGWVAYSFSAVLSAIGDGRLMPPAELSATLINVKSGTSRDIQSWILSRLIRDFEPPEESDRGLAVVFFRTSANKIAGISDRDWVYYSGITVIIAQLGIAAIPGGLNGNWMILILTFGGTMLALLGTALPQWGKEKWAARRLKGGQREVVCLTRGNGSPCVLVIRSEGCGIKLEDLAVAREVRSRMTVFATLALVVLWLVHLLTAESLSTDAWYSLAVGALGMAQNAVAAGVRRSPGALGFHLEDKIVVYDKKVFKALVRAEDLEPHVGLELLPVFFPGGLRADEELWRQEKVAQYAKEKEMVESGYSASQKL